MFPNYFFISEAQQLQSVNTFVGLPAMFGWHSKIQLNKKQADVRKGLYLVVCLLSFLLTTAAVAQNVNVSGALVGNGSYATLAAAFTAINGGAQTGENITILITGNTSEPATTGASLNAGTWNSVLIKPDGGAARTITGNMAVPMVELNGADYVTIDGLNSGGNSLTISNTSTSSVNLTSTMRIRTDATYNVITRCTFLGSSTTSGANDGGTIVIRGNAALSGNDFNVISYCDIAPAGGNLPTRAISFFGQSAALPNNSDTIRNCNIYDYFSPTLNSYGIHVQSFNSDIVIKDNRFYQTATRTISTGNVTHSAIKIDNTSGNNYSVTGNIIGFASSGGTGNYSLAFGSLTGFFVPIDVNAGTTTATNIQGNTIKAISVTGNNFTDNLFKAINITGGTVNIGNQTGNVIGDSVLTSSINISGSLMSGFCSAYGILLSGSGNCITNNNKIFGFLLNLVGTGKLYCIASSLSGSWECKNNIIGSSVANSISNMGSFSDPITRGIENTGGAAEISGNLIRNIKGRGSFQGKSIAGISITSAGNQNISGNTIHTLIDTISGQEDLLGLYINSTGTNIIERNFIHSLKLNTHNGLITGIFAQSGTNEFRNNMIQLGIDAYGNSVNVASTTYGIYDAGGVNNFYHNSIYIGGNSSVGGKTYCVHSINGSVRNYQNNIFFNGRSTTGAGGSNAAYRVDTLTGFTSNYNVLFVNGSGGIIGFNAGSTMDDWRGLTGQDNQSKNLNPQYVNPNGNVSLVNLHLNGPLPTPAEQNGTSIGSVTSDIDNETRSSLTPNDIGADAGNFAQYDEVPMSISYSLIPNPNFFTSVQFNSVTITDGNGVNNISGTNPRVYFKKRSDANTFNDNTSSTAGWKYSEAQNSSSPFNFVIDLTRLNSPPVLSDTVQYFVIAQDLASAPHVSINSGTFTQYPLSVALTSSAFPVTGAINSFTFLPPSITLSGASSGNGQYSTLASVFNIINSTSQTSANISILIYGNTFEPSGGATLNNGTWTSITISSTGGAARTISAAVTAGLPLINLNGADNVTIDGLNSGGNSLTISNTTVSATVGTSAIRFVNDATKNTVKNCTITSCGTENTTGTISFLTTSGSNGNDSNTIQNNDITRGSGGPSANCISNSGSGVTTSTKNSGNKIIGNRLYDFERRGLFDLGNSAGTLYEGNEIYSTTPLPGASFVVGFEVDAVTIEGFICRNNYIHDLRSSVSATIYGMALWNIQSLFTGDVYNNLISLSDNSSHNLKGIHDNSLSGVNYNFYFNSINIYGSVTGSQNSDCYFRNTSSCNFKNNILLNSRTGGSGKHYAIRTNLPLTSFTSNYNDIHVTGGTGNVFGKLDATERINLADWRTASGKDSNSVSGIPNFVSNSNLHIDSTANSVVSNLGTPIAGITTDYDENTRNVTSPDIGADEYNSPSPLSGDYTVGLSLFNSIAGTNISFEKRINKILKEAEDNGKPVTREVEEESFVPVENGKIYTGPLSIKRVNKPNLPGDAMGGIYPTISAALQDLQGSGVSGPVRFLLVDASYSSETLPLNIIPWSGASSVNTVTIKPNTGDNSTISGSNSTAIIDINNGDHFVLDGSNINGGTSKNLTVINSNAAAASIRLINDAMFNTVKNCLLVSTSVSSGVVFFSTTTGTSGNDSNLIQNNDITKNTGTSQIVSTNGIYNSGTGTNSLTKNSGNRITGNHIFDCLRGIYDQGNSAGNLYEENEIYTVTQFLQFPFMVGFEVNATSIEGFTFRNNNIHDLKMFNVVTIYGMALWNIQSSFTGNIYNNFISLSDGNSNDLKGIHDGSASGVNYNIYLNSINIYGSTSGVKNSDCYFRSASNTNLKDNILLNSRTSGLGKHYAIRTLSPLTSFTSNYNDIYTTGGVGNVFAKLDTSEVTNLSSWRSLTGKDLNSISANPGFFSNTNLHIDTTASSPVNAAGTPVAGIATDFDGNTRDVSTPDIGADEFGPVSLSINMNLTMLIEGFYNSGTNLQVSDTIKVFLRNSSSPFSAVDSAKAVVSDSGKASLTFNNATSGSYYIQILHRNAIETWSANPVSVSSSSSYDFSTAASQAFGYNMKQVDNSPVRFAIYSGDVNQDGTVDLSDLTLIDNDSYNFISGYVSTDVNGDGAVDLTDAAIADNNAFNFVSAIRP